MTDPRVPAGGPPAKTPLDPRRAAVLLAAALVATAAIRLWLLSSSVLQLDADEAVTGLVARDILHGHHRAFFPGQDYMGTLEQYLQAAVLWVLPDSDLTLRLPQVALAVVACLLVHRLARRCRFSERRALLAAGLFAVGPYAAVLWSVKSRGAYISAMVLGLAGMVVALSVDEDDRRRLAKVALFGCIGGAALWANQQAAYLLVPSAWWLLATVRRRWLSSAAAGLAGFVLGAAPSLWHTLAGGPGPFANHEGATSAAERAQRLLTDTLPDALGVRDDGKPLASWLPPALVVLLVVGAVGAALYAHRASILALLRLRTEGRQPTDVPLLAVVVLPLLYIQSAAGSGAGPRVMFTIFGVVPILVAALPAPRAWIRTNTDAAWAGVLAIAVFGLHTWVGADRLIGEDDGPHPAAAGQPVVLEDLPEVVDALRAAEARTAYADYWLAHPLAWVADGDVLVESLYTRRFPAVSEAVAADPSPALVVARSEVRDVADALDARGVAYDQQLAGGWGVFTGITPGIHVPWTGSVVEALRQPP